MSIASIKIRFIVSVGTNILRAIISFLTGLVVAKGLDPSGYGDLAFLLGSFAAIRALLDMGTTSAFYTFISQSRRNLKFHLLYYGWLGFQFILILLLVVGVLPRTVIDGLWLGHSRDVILLALAASFVQQQVWTTVIQIGESSRNTIKIQLTNLFVALLHMALILVIYYWGWLSVTSVLTILIFEYTLATVFAIWILKTPKSKAELPDPELREILSGYWRYCKPLIVLSGVSFLYQFADRWLLQRFGGAEQQGYYQIAAQFAAVSLLATTSITHIFWKEMAEANKRGDAQRVAYLYHKVSRGLLMLGAVLACFLVPWAEEIVRVLLGPAYREAWPVLAVMFLYPIHQSMGQVNATMFMASGQTRIYTIIGIAGMAVSIPATYFLLAPANSGLVAGAGLGALGLAIKMIGESVVFVNVQTWMIARTNGWKYEWHYQVFGVLSLLGLGYLVKAAACLLMPVACESADKLMFSLSILSSGVLYAIGVLAFFWTWPSIAGLARKELIAMLRK